MSTPAEQIKQALALSCKDSDGTLLLPLCQDKLEVLIGLLGLAGEWEADCLRQLSLARIDYLNSPAPLKFKSGRELDRHVDELCPDEYSQYVESKLLNENLNSAVRGLVTLISSLK